MKSTVGPTKDDYGNLIEVRRIRLYEQIADQLEELVIATGFEPGHRLPTERDMARQLRVGRPTIREAYRVLQDRGLVTLSPGTGTRVSAVSSRAISRSVRRFLTSRKVPTREIMEMREILEPEVAALSAARATPELIEGMEQSLSELAAHHDDLGAYVEADFAFHVLLFTAAGNDTLSAVYSQVMNALKDAMREVTVYERRTGRHDPLSHHTILRAIKARDAEEARRVVREHLAGIRRMYDEIAGETL